MASYTTVDPGLLRDLVEVFENQSIPDGYGGHTESLVPLGGLWSKIEPYKGNEIVRGQRIEDDITHEMVCRYTSAIQPGRIIRYSPDGVTTREFYVVSVINPDFRYRFLKVTMREGGPR